jgi:hypothetical protein
LIEFVDDTQEVVRIPECAQIHFTYYNVIGTGTPAKGVPHRVLSDGSVSTGGNTSSDLQEVNNNTTSAHAANQERIW